MAAKPDDVESAAAGGAMSGSSDDAANEAPPSSSNGKRGGDKRNAKRMLNFQKDHARRFALEPVARDTETGVVTSVVCLFCKHFGREERAGKKRKATTNFKYFKHSFRTDQYMQHHLSQHPRNWAKYDAASDQDKRVFFPLTSSSNGSGGVAALTDAAAEALVEDGSKRSKHAKIAAAASALMNRGDEKVSFDVKKTIVDLVVGELLWRPQGLRSCNLFSTNMRLRAVKKSGITGDGDEEGGDADGNDEEMEEAVHGHTPSARQMYYIAVRHRAQLDLAVDFMASGQTYRQIARALSAIVKRTDVDAFMSAAEEEVTDLVRLTSAVSLNSVSKLLDKSWAFSVWMHTAAHDVQRPYLDIRLRLYNSSSGNGKIHNFHLVAIPLMEHQSEEKMYLTFEKTMDAVFPPWRGYLIGLGSDGDAKISSDRVSEFMTRIQQEVSNPVYRTWCGSHQLDRTMKQFYSALLGGTFMSSFKTLVAYIRSQEHLVLEMGHPPSLVTTNPWLAMGKDTKWITDKRVRLRKHLDEEKPAMAAPDDVWWVAFFIANWVAVRANETFKKLQNKHLVVSQQVALMQEFATDLIQNFHIQGPFTSTSALRLLESQTKDQYFPSRQGEYAISKSSMREFMSDLGVFVNTIVSRVDPVTLDIVFENLATCLATLVESLLGLSVGSHDHNNNATDVLPPVLPRELAALSGREFASLLERHSDRVRMFFSEEEMDVIDQEHQELRRAATKEKALKAALTEGGSSDESNETTSFEYAWAQTGGRFKALQHFAGGLATVFPRDDQTPELLDVPSMSDRENNNVCWRMLPMIDFSLEGTLHAQQFHKLQEILQEGTSVVL